MRLFSVTLLSILFSLSLVAQDFQSINATFDTALHFRNIGPFRGGRSAAVTGVQGKPNLFYFGSTGGGVWKTEDGGRTWGNISDGYFGGSIGAIEVAPSDANVIYVGGGEVTVRGNVSSGWGMWKSEDAGRTWKSAGLEKSRHIPRLRVHPKDHNLVYAAVLGDLYKPTQERGIYRSKNGGKTWERILFVNENAGAVDLSMDPSNPRNLFASFWRVRRTPHSLSSGGEGSSLWKSTDGGDTWTDISRNEGLPKKDTLGIIGVTVSPLNSDRVWAIVEAASGGVFRSDNGGNTWKKVNSDRSLRQRAWYYTRIYADTEDENGVYVMNVAYHKSTDGGKTFSKKYAPHGDHHDLWVAPEDSRRMIIGDDGGAQISYDGGATWSTYRNQPTSQFYRVTTDDAFPYRIYAAQQDNSTIRIEHRTNGWSIGNSDWEPTAGGESGHIAIDPTNMDVVYGGSYHGYLTRYDHKTKQRRAINVWPEDNMGHGAEDAEFRFQWNYPIFFSPHDPKKLYCASNQLHVSMDEGQTWKTISPDLTTNDKNRQKSSGGPITQDNTSVEYYCTIFAAAESKREKDLLWVGSDDGLVHISRDAGANWNNVTPRGLPKWAQVNSLEIDPHRDGSCYLAVTAYKSGDYKPYLFHTENYGATWQQINRGIPSEYFTRVVRCDDKVQGLLYAGTEAGLYVSKDDGGSWQAMQLNLPTVPVTDMVVKNNNLVVATQGRSLWVLDDLMPIKTWARGDFLQKNKVQLFEPSAAYRMNGGQSKSLKSTGHNHHSGAAIYFYLTEMPSEKDTVQLTILSAEGDTIKTFSNKNKKKDKLPKLRAGLNEFIWDMRYPNAEKFDGMILWSYSLRGPKAVPGTYSVELAAFGEKKQQNFEILADPRVSTGQEGFQEQFDFVQSVGDKVTEMHETIKDIRALRTQMKTLKKRMPKDSTTQSIRDYITEMDSTITIVEKAFYQTQNRSAQDPLNFPVRLNDKLANLMGLNTVGDFPPTSQSYAVRKKLFAQVDAEMAVWKRVLEVNVPKLNRMVRERAVDVIRVEKRD